LQNKNPADKLTAENKSINLEPAIQSARHNENESQESQASKANTAPSDLNIKEWFSTLTLEQRVNALTTTSPYLSEVLINMHK